MRRKTPVYRLTPDEIQYLLNHGKYNTLKMLDNGTVFCTVKQQTVIIQRYIPRKLK